MVADYQDLAGREKKRVLRLIMAYCWQDQTLLATAAVIWLLSVGREGGRVVYGAQGWTRRHRQPLRGNAVEIGGRKGVQLSTTFFVKGGGGLVCEIPLSTGGFRFQRPFALFIQMIPSLYCNTTGSPI